MAKIFLTTVSLWALAWIAAPFSFAKAPALYCEATSKLADRVTGCVDNEIVFGDAAVACLERFEKEADDSGKTLAKSLVGGGDAAGKNKKQAGHLAESGKNYADVSAKLLFLIGLGKIALGQVEDYKKNLAPPEDVENAALMGFTTESFLKSIPCFEDNRQLLDNVAKDFRNRIKELEGARAAALKLEGVSKAAQAGLDRNASIPSEAADSTKGKSAPEKVTEKPKGGASDITGTEKKKSELPATK